MRSKEHAHDYRYFPEPDLLPLRIGDEWLSRIRAEMPELPADRRRRFTESYGLRDYDAGVLTATRALGDYFERAVAASGDARGAANWVMTDLMAALPGGDIAEAPVTPEHLGQLVALIGRGEISGKMAKEIFAKMAATGEAPGAIVEREGLKQISDAGAVEKIVDEVIAANPKQVSEYRAGKAAVLKYLVGQVMKASRGQANPAAVNEILADKLK
jgi:aspartyl-tRNA(Asn)/glutamyl-tRNA(Gln) amidotransferase subunit B